MTCAECLAALYAADLTARREVITPRPEDAAVPPSSLDPASLAEHVALCASCRHAMALFAAGEQALAASLDASVPTRAPSDVAAYAWDAARRQWWRRSHMVLGTLGGLLVLGTATWWSYTELRRFLSPPPPAVTATFSLSCLSSAQAAALLQPYMPPPENPRWQAEHFSVSPAQFGIQAVTVRAPQPVLDRIPLLLAQFEQDPNAACRARAGNLPTRPGPP